MTWFSMMAWFPGITWNSGELAILKQTLMGLLRLDNGCWLIKVRMAPLLMAF
jgi:hypothetical protein